jgi:thiosulfate dehydrogenase
MIRLLSLALLLIATPVLADPPAWVVPNADALPDDEHGKLVKYGRRLTEATYAEIGPQAADPAKRYSGNNLACQNCHLEAGTKQFGLPFLGVAKDFPQYRAREGRIGTLAERVNGCMTRSMAGKPLPEDSPEMKAFVAYIAFLSTGAKQEGRGPGKMTELSRAANIAHGGEVYANTCSACHGPNGRGKANGGNPALGYEIPPLWGNDTFNDGAGMARLISAANFIHSNMPNGTNWQEPAISVDDAWDVAAFMINHPRPHKADLDSDYPKRFDKAVDAAYGPFADGFPAQQHKLGPFEPIRTKLKTLQPAPKPDALTEGR